MKNSGSDVPEWMTEMKKSKKKKKNQGTKKVHQGCIAPEIKQFKMMKRQEK